MLGYGDYSPFRGGYVYANPYEITSYVCKKEYDQYDTDMFYMEVKCRTDKAVSELCNYAYIVRNESPDMIVCAGQYTKYDDYSPFRGGYVKVFLQSSYKPALDKIRLWINKENRGVQSHLNYLVNDCAITEEMTETYDNALDNYYKALYLNVGRCNGKTTRNAEEMVKEMKLYFDNKTVDLGYLTSYDPNGQIAKIKIYPVCPSPKKIIFSGPKCVVIWTDDTKTIVSCGENDNWDEYAAYCAALAKKIYGTTSAVHRLVNKKSNVKEFKEAKELSEKAISNITPPDPFNDIRKENDNDR